MSEFIPDDVFGFDDLGLEPDLLSEPVPDLLSEPDPMLETGLALEDLVADVPDPDADPVAPRDMALPNPFPTSEAAGIVSAATGVIAVFQGMRRKRKGRDT